MIDDFLLLKIHNAVTNNFALKKSGAINNDEIRKIKNHHHTHMRNCEKNYWKYHIAQSYRYLLIEFIRRMIAQFLTQSFAIEEVILFKKKYKKT